MFYIVLQYFPVQFYCRVLEGEIVRKYESGQSQTSIALDYNIAQMSVSRILRKHRDLARKESNGPSASTLSILAYKIYDQTQN